MDADTGSRALNAANDLLELLRLAQGALDRVAQEVHGVPFEHAEQISGELRRLTVQVQRLHNTIDRVVAREASAAAARGYPLRRATDRHPQLS